MELLIQGIKGSYSYLASLFFIKKLKKLGIKNIKIRYKRDFKSIIKEIKDFAVIPVENSLIGSIYNNYTLIMENDLKILFSVNLKIKHSLLAKTWNLNEIKYVYSHPAALEQCKSFIDKHRLKAVSFQDTASAALFVSKNKRKDIAAIASPICSKLFNLKILNENIQDNNNNFTRFFLISKNFEVENLKETKEKNLKFVTSFLFELKDKPAALFKALMPFATYNINLKKIESIINPKKPFSYKFILEAEIKKDDKVFNHLIEELNLFVNNLKFSNTFIDFGFTELNNYFFPKSITFAKKASN